MQKLPLIYTILLWVAGLCGAAQFAKMGLFLPELQQVYPAAESATGFLLTAISLVGALLGLISGILVGNIPARTVLLAGLAIGSLISILQALYLPIGFLLTTRVVEGVSHLAIVVAAPTLIARYTKGRLRTAAMTLWGSFFGVAFALTSWLGLPFVNSSGVHSLFLLHGLITGLIAILVAFIIPKTSQSRDRTVSDRQLLSMPGLFEQHKQAWLSPYVAAPAAGWFFYTITYVALLAILPGLVPPDQRVFVATSMPLASIASSLTVGVLLLQKYSAIRVLQIGFTTAAVIAPLFIMMSEKSLVCILLFAALGLVQGASFAAIPELNKEPSKQALAYGAIAQAGNTGNLLGTPVLLLVFSYGGDTYIITSVVLFYVLAVLTHLMFAKQRQRISIFSQGG